MMLKIGNKSRSSGFTLIEVMVTVAILSLSTVMISQSNLMSMSAYGRYVNRLGIQNWAEEKVWEAKERILESVVPEVGKTSGEVEIGSRAYRWELELVELREKEELHLYAINLDVSWAERGQAASVKRHSYLLKSKE
ncbi:MAG: prepilin-type N-terminal cleavage/methylation domain-containing protein [Candidatus Omnitrophica bacterium]|nr:prepilin-type N-terminal cleavage/methylation domain-containing protein [Candidatus Omnitrophota bacterium]